jgi:hypothetical protein
MKYTTTARNSRVEEFDSHKSTTEISAPPWQARAGYSPRANVAFAFLVTLEGLRDKLRAVFSRSPKDIDQDPAKML